MNDNRPLATQVDALIGKHQATSDDNNIPVLTDLVAAPDWTPPEDAPPLPTAEPDVLTQLTEDEIDALSQDIFVRVSQRIDSELAVKLEARLNEALQAQLHNAITDVLTDMKLSIANEIGDAVNAALADRLRD